MCAMITFLSWIIPPHKKATFSIEVLPFLAGEPHYGHPYLFHVLEIFFNSLKHREVEDTPNKLNYKTLQI
jgi:hypothetical protein